MITTLSFDQFRAAIAALPERPAYAKSDLLIEPFRLFGDRGLDAYYVPFHRLNRGTRVVLIGLTPGWTQMELAYRAARDAMAEGLSDQDVFLRVELTASFCGPMRRNLVSMLDGIELNRWLGLDSCEALFEEDCADSVHFTSVISAPTFMGGKNYTGYNPAPMDVPKVRDFIWQNLVPELQAMRSAVLVPLGKAVDEVMSALRAQGAIGDRAVLSLPHPSGANGHRRAAYERGLEGWRALLRKTELPH